MNTRPTLTAIFYQHEKLNSVTILMKELVNFRALYRDRVETELDFYHYREMLPTSAQ